MLLILFVPLTVQSKSYYDPQGVIYKPACDPVKAVGQDPQDCYYASPQLKIPHYGTHQGDYGGNCVSFAKRYTGFAPETWGNGGKYLPLTQTPEIGDVVVFTYTHVAVITDIQDGVLILIESNIHLDGLVTLDRQISETDSTIRGYYHPL